MKRIFCLYLLSISVSAVLLGSDCNPVYPSVFIDISPDSLRDRQFLYNGVLWKNSFRRIDGDPYFISNVFYPGRISFNGRTFLNISLRYDICLDEIMTPRSLDQIVQLNREMVDSFTLVLNNRFYKFINITSGSSGLPEGYINQLYRGESELYVKYRKKIFTEISSESDGEFYEVSLIFFVDRGKVYQVSRLKDLCRILEQNKKEIRKFVRENRLKVTARIPESFVPVVRYYDSIRK